MAKLPSTIYKAIAKRQHDLYRSGASDGSIPIEDAWEEFQEAGYRISTANKWLLNWAVCRCLKFEGKSNDRIRLGDFHHLQPSDCLNNVWLPVKEVWVKHDENDRLASGGRL